MIYADGRLDPAEKKIFYAYMAETDVDLSSAHTVDFKTELSVFDDCKVEEKLGIFCELYSLALIDRVYAEEERHLIQIAKDYWGISDEKVNEIDDVLKKVFRLQDELIKIVNTD